MKKTTRKSTKPVAKIPAAPEEFRALCQAYCLVWKPQIDRAWAASRAAVAVDSSNTERRWDVTQAFIEKEAKAELRRMKTVGFDNPDSDIHESWGDLAVSFTDAAMLTGMAVMFRLLTEGRR